MKELIMNYLPYEYRRLFAYCIAYTLVNLIPFVILYGTGLFGNKFLMYKTRRTEVPKISSFLYHFVGMSKSRSKMPSRICYLYEKVALWSFLIMEIVCTVYLRLIAGYLEKRIISLRIAIVISSIEVVLWVISLVVSSLNASRESYEFEYVAGQEIKSIEEIAEKEAEDLGLNVTYHHEEE